MKRSTCYRVKINDNLNDKNWKYEKEEQKDRKWEYFNEDI